MALPTDICVCGDYRSQHKGGTGPCKFNKPKGAGHHAAADCTKFRLGQKETARKKPLAQLLKDWRAARDISAADAAELLGLPRRTLEGIEQGRPFRYEKMLQLALNAP